MPFHYENLELLHQDEFSDLANWFHEGIGQLEPAPEGGMRLNCTGSRQGREGCMAFFRPTLPDQIAVEYELIIRSHGGLMINFMAMRGLGGEDMIEDRDKLPQRTGIFPNYFGKKWGLQSYHVSVSRFTDKGEHTGTSNWRRNPGLLMVGHGVDPIQEINRSYHIRLTKDAGHGQLFVNGQFAHAFIDRDDSHYPIPTIGKFGFRLIGSEVMADIHHFRVYRAQLSEGDAGQVWSNKENYGLDV